MRQEFHYQNVLKEMLQEKMIQEGEANGNRGGKTKSQTVLSFSLALGTIRSDHSFVLYNNLRHINNLQ